METSRARATENSPSPGYPRGHLGCPRKHETTALGKIAELERISRRLREWPSRISARMILPGEFQYNPCLTWCCSVLQDRGSYKLGLAL